MRPVGRILDVMVGEKVGKEVGTVVNEGECEAQVITPDLIGGFKCGLPAGHGGDEHERRLPGHELHPKTLKATEIVIRWKVTR